MHEWSVRDHKWKGENRIRMSARVTESAVENHFTAHIAFLLLEFDLSGTEWNFFFLLSPSSRAASPLSFVSSNNCNIHSPPAVCLCACISVSAIYLSLSLFNVEWFSVFCFLSGSLPFFLTRSKHPVSSCLFQLMCVLFRWHLTVNRTPRSRALPLPIGYWITQMNRTQ